jgi:disulfide bond formation protein DsbB
MQESLGEIRKIKGSTQPLIFVACFLKEMVMTNASHEPGNARKSTSPTQTAQGTATNLWLGVAFAVALLTLGGSLFLTWGMELQACPLCFYQRTFAMSLVAVLGMGLLTGAAKFVRLSLLALPLAVAGLGVASFHTYLEVSGKLECPAGIIGLGTAPQQSLGMFLVLSVLLLMDIFRGKSAGLNYWLILGGGVVLGGLLAVASSTSNPPMKKPPREVYEKLPVVCRPPQ